MKENVRGEGSWGTKTVKGKEYVRYQKWVGGRIRKKIEVCGKTRTECLSKMKEKERDYLEKENMGLSSVAPAENRTLVEEAMWNWLYTYKKPAMKPKSFDRIVGTYNAHVKDKRIGRTEIRNVTPDDIMEYMNGIRSQVSVSTAKKVYELFNMFFSHYFLKTPAASPMIGTVKPRESTEVTMDEDGIAETGEMVVLTDSEIERLTEELHRERTSMCYFLEFLMWTFVRLGEAEAIQFKDVDLEEGTVKLYKSWCRVKKEDAYNKDGNKAAGYEWRLVTPKTEKGKRVMRLCPKAVEALKNHYRMLKTKRIEVLGGDSEIPQGTFIFNTVNGNPYADQNLNQLLRSALKRAGIDKKLTVHGLRHTGVSYFLRHGADLKTISVLAGHSNVSTTANIYYNVVGDQLDGIRQEKYWEAV